MRYILLLMACLIALPASAEVFIGVKAGSMMVDVSSTKNPRNVALNLGYRLDSYLADISLVGEINRTLRDGDTRRDGDLEFESDAVYLFVRTTRSLFASFRVGITRNEVVTGANKRHDDGLLLGGGIGIVVGKTLVHLEYTSMAGDANFLSLGLEF